MKILFKTFVCFSIFVSLFISNGCKDNPTDPIEPTPTDQIIFFDDFESSNISGYIVPSGHTPPVITTLASFSPTHSITLPTPRNEYAIMGKMISPSITSNTIGLNCRMMKSNLSDMSNMLLMLFSGSVGPQQELVLGFYRDSIYLSIENSSNPTQNVSKNIGIINSNTWYNIKIEYSFETKKASFIIDGNKVFESNYTVSSVDHFYFGDFSTDISPVLDKVLFIDDMKLYKR